MKLFHSWKRWQLIALVCVVLTAVLTLVFVLQGGGSEDLPGADRQLRAAARHEDAGRRYGAARNSRSHRGAHSGPDGSHRSSDRSVYGGHKGHRIPDRRDAACHGGPDGAAVTEPAAPSCTVSISCTTVLDNWDKLSEAKRSIVPSNGIILGTVTVELQEGDTVFSVLQRVVSDYNIQMEYSVSPLYQTTYIEGLGNLYEKDCGARSGWMFAVNGVFPNYGASDCTVQDGDSIRWLYTCDLGKDLS